MTAGTPPLPLGLDPLIAEAKERARRRRLWALAAAGVLLAGILATDLALSAAGGGGASPDTIPWLPTRPNLGAANPPLAPPCTASQLGASLSLQGATMQWVGPITLVNRSSQRCSLLGRPRLSFANATSLWQETRLDAPGMGMLHDPLAPPRGSLRALAPGEHVAAMLWWSNWCGTGAKPGGVLTQAPSAIVLAAPGGGNLHLTGDNGSRGLPSPVCNGGPGSVSKLQASRFTPWVPQGPPSSALPLRASILSTGTGYVKGMRIAGPTLIARAGHRLSFTVVLTNTSRRPFRFGRTCPAYTEGVKTQDQAYVLNCHAVGVIAPHRSVRFAMRARVPADTPRGYAFGWSLAPHSFNAPQAMATLQLR